MLASRYLVASVMKCARSKSSKPTIGTPEKSEKKKNSKDWWKYKNKEMWKQTSNFFHNVQNKQQFGEVVRAKWKDARQGSEEKIKEETNVQAEKNTVQKKIKGKSKKNFEHKFF